MFIVIGFMFSGILTGYLFKKRTLSFLNQLIMAFIWLLLWLLGYEVGMNENVVSKFHLLGFEAFVIAVASTLGSVIMARTLLPPDKKANYEKWTLSVLFSELKYLKGSAVILLFFIGGVIFGLFKLIPPHIVGSQLSFYVLCALMFSVGFSLGHQPDTIRQFKTIPSKVLFLPFGTMIGTFAGAIIVGLLLHHTLFETLAVSSGFGYYSLSGILITQYKGAELGTIALLSNIFREIFTLIFAPQMARYFGKLAPIASGGATTMDTTFPIIIQSSGKEFSIVSIYSGFILDFSVPFLVTLWCSI